MTRAATICVWTGVLATLASGSGCSRGEVAYRATARPPATRVDTVTDTVHGVTLTDDYRWLEGASHPDGSNPGQTASDVAAWTTAQRSYTRTVLDAVPGRADVAAKLAALMDVGDVSVPLMSGNRYFFWHRQASEQSPTVFVRDGALGVDRALLRPDDLTAAGLVSTRWIMPSPDGRWLAFGAVRGGDADMVLRMLDVASGKPLPIEIPGSPRAVQWLPDGSGFIYQRRINPADPATNAVLFHQVGQESGRDRLLFRQYTVAEEPRLASTAGPFASLSRDGRWLVAGYWTSTDSNDLWLVNFDDLRRTGRMTLRTVTIGTPGRASGTIVGDTLFLRTTKGAPNGRVVAVDITNPAEPRWRDVVPERRDASIADVAFGRGLIAVTYLRHASNVTEVFEPSGRPIGTLAQPGIGTTALATSDDRTEAFLLFQSFIHPPTVFRMDLRTPTEQGRQWKASVPVKPASVVVEQVRYRSKDGTEVTMFLVRRRDLVPNGALPTLLAGYGALGVAMTPIYTADWAQWLDAGGLVAVPHVRGGGEYGASWHAAGARDRKMTSFDDFVAAAEWLIANRYTTPERLALYGVEAGGLLAGGALVSRPDLFRAAVLLRPLLDMLRYDRFGQASAFTQEFGPPADRVAFGWLRAYSPYQRVTPGTKYPAVLLAGSESDPVVHALHARKMAARLQAATTSDPAERPVLLSMDAADRTSADAGALQALVDQRVFLMWQLGMLRR